MTPEAITGWVNAIAGGIRQLGELGVSVNLPAMILVFATMAAVKRLDRRAWQRSGKRRGSRPGDAGYLVAWYPALAVVLGAAWGLLWWILVDGGTIGAAVASGLVSGAIMAAVFHIVKTWSKYRQLIQKLRSEGGG